MSLYACTLYPLRETFLHVLQKREGDLWSRTLVAVHEPLESHGGVPPDPQRIQQAYQAGNVALNPVPGAVNLVFSNYAQPGDKMTLTFNTATKKIAALSVDTYMDDAKDRVALQVQMGSLPDGTNYVQQSVLTASGKELTVTTTNSNYQRL